MTKRELAALEKLFSAEVTAAIEKHFTHLVQSKAKVFDELASKGFCEKKTITRRDRFGTLSVTGWQLTIAGNLAYCLSCDDAEEES